MGAGTEKAAQLCAAPDVEPRRVSRSLVLCPVRFNAGERWSVSRLMETFRKNQIVRVSTDHHWAKGALGTVAEPPAPVRTLTGDWQGCFRMVKTLQGPAPYYWVNFDEPQIDGDGDGPYAGGEIDARYLSVVHGG
jgi:hypothetical protein